MNATAQTRSLDLLSLCAGIATVMTTVYFLAASLVG